MSELKARLAYFSEDDYDKGANKICAKVSDCGYDRRNEWWSYAFEDEVYLKSEADKVIAEKDAKILALDAEVFKQKHHAELFFDERNYAEEQLRHYKYKRCLAEVERCDITALYYSNFIPKVLNKDIEDADRQKVFRRFNHYKKWRKRWLELAKKFKEAK